MTLNSSKTNYPTFFIFFLILIIGVIFYKDFGFNIDEKFHRQNGFYWLLYIAKFFNLGTLEQISSAKLAGIKGFTLDSVEYYNKYGIIFDVPAALLELVFKLNDPIKYYYLRHLLVFLYFFVGLIYFYKILKNRFEISNLALFGVLLIFITPRIFGDSFQNTKDIIFLSFLIISAYYAFRIKDKFSLLNILLFSFFSASAISLRLFGFILIISLILIELVTINRKNFKSIINKICILIIAQLIFLILVWPLLWENPIENFLNYFPQIDEHFNAKVFFLGKYHDSALLPDLYLLIWILISTPVLHLILFFFGFYICFSRFLKRYLSIREGNIFQDFWRGKKEKKDFFILINFLGILFYFVFLNMKFYNSWRLGYFLYFFLIYFAIYGLNLIFYKKIFFSFNKLYIQFLILIFFIFTVYRMVLYHPFQSLYFNFLVPDQIKNSVEVDYTGLSSFHFLKKIIGEKEKINKVKIGVVSWYPLWRVLELIEHENSIKIVSIKDNHKADFLYSNRISDVDKNYNNKYDIPTNFKIKEQFIIDNVIIYEVYQRQR